MDNVEDVDTLASQINGFYDVDSDTSRDIETIIGHRFVSGILKLKVVYSTGRTRSGKEWHPISLVKIKDAPAVANYVLQNDFGMIHNDI